MNKLESFLIVQLTLSSKKYNWNSTTMNYVKPQNVPAPFPQQVQTQTQPQNMYAPQQNVQQVQQPGYAPQTQQVQPQGVDFYGASISPQDMQAINQMYNVTCQTLGMQVNDQATVEKSLYFGARDLFKTIYVNQVSSQRGESPKTPDYEQAQNVYEQAFGTVGKLKVTELQLCCIMKAFAPNLLPDLSPGQQPHSPIKEYILNHNWHSQNVRQNSGGISRNNNSNGNGNVPTNGNPFGNPGGAQSKAAAAAGFAPQPQPIGFVPGQQVQPGYMPQQTAQAVAGAMPSYGG